MNLVAGPLLPIFALLWPLLLGLAPGGPGGGEALLLPGLLPGAAAADSLEVAAALLVLALALSLAV